MSPVDQEALGGVAGGYRTDHVKNLVGFQVGEVLYAVQIQLVREVVYPHNVVSLTNAPPDVIGVADHRGNVLPVVDLRLRFGLERQEVTKRTKWVIVRPTRVSSRAVALQVDRVTDVFGTTNHAERSVPELASGDEARGIIQVFAYAGELIFVLAPKLVAVSALNLSKRQLTMPPPAPQR